MPPTVTQARDAILRARNSFADRVLARAAPKLPVHARAHVLAREMNRSHTYAVRMHDRLRIGYRRLAAAQLEPDVHDRGIARLIETEKRYLSQHMNAVAWRLAREADQYVLEESGDTHGYWMLDPSKMTHTADCLAAAGRLWPVQWLREHGPQTRHHGCGCKVLPASRARGLPIKQGFMSAAQARLAAGPARFRESSSNFMNHESRNENLEETVHVPLRPGVRGGDPYGRHRHVSVAGDLHPDLHRHLVHYAHAVRTGDAEGMNHHYRLMLRHAARLRNPDLVDTQTRLIHRIHAVAVNPRGAHLPYGSTVLVAPKHGTPVPMRVPISVPERAGRETGWTANGHHAWLVEPNALGPHTTEHLAKLAEGKRFTVRETEHGHTIVGASGAAALERRHPALRHARIVREGEPLGDPTPMDIPPAKVERMARYSRHAHITKMEISDAAELAAPDIARVLHELGMTSSDGYEVYSLHARAHGHTQTPLDARLGDLGVEVKASPLRGMTFTSRHSRQGSISPGQREEKLRDAEKRGLRPALVQAIVDPESGRLYAFVHVYEPGEGFHERRLSLAARELLVSGRLTPGQRVPVEGHHAQHDTVFVGAFPMRANPVDDRDRHGLSHAEIQRRLDEQQPEFERHVPEHFKLPGGRVAQSPRAERNAAIVAAAQEPGAVQREIAERFGVTQQTISNVLRDAGIKRGRGARTDRLTVRQREERDRV